MGNSNSPKWLILPGSLILDVISVKNNRSIWRSVYPLKITEQDNSKDIQIKTNTALNVMLKQFPSGKELIESQPLGQTFTSPPKLSVYN